MKKWFFSFTLLLIFCNTFSQDRVFYGGFFPEMAISHSFQKKLQGTFKVESSHIQFDDRQGEIMQWKYVHYRTDLQGFVGIKFNPYWKAAIGYQYRVEGDGPDSHRSIQQVGFVQNSPRIRFSHRLRLDQTFSTGDEDPEYRIRYRFALKSLWKGKRWMLVSFTFFCQMKLFLVINQLKVKLRIAW
jgi:hypothetical protein